LNHSLFWENLDPKNRHGGVLPDKDSDFGKVIIGKWGSFEKFIEIFNAQTVAVQGSGWGWLVYDRVLQDVNIMTTANQNRTQDIAPVVPLLVVDVWEHAYYVDYHNRRADFLKNIWQIINWKTVEKRFSEAHKLL